MISWYLRRFRPVRRHRYTFVAPRLETIEDRVTPTASFTASAAFAASPASPNGLEWNTHTGDFNNDGKQDFVSYGGTGVNKISVYLGTGAGTWTLQGTINTNTVNIRPQSVVVGDFTGKTAGTTAADGNDDIAFLTEINTLVVFPSQGDGNFGTVGGMSVPFTYVSLSAGDLNGDGAADLVAGRFGSGGPNGTAGEYATFLNDGKGTFTIGERTQTNGLNEIRIAPTLADVDADGKLDMVAVNSIAIAGGGVAGIYYGKGDGSFDRGNALAFPFGNGPTDQVVGDFDGDGLKDVAVAVSTDAIGGPTNFQIYRQLAAGQFASAPTQTFSTPSEAVDLVAADFDYDGDAEIVITPFDGLDATIRVYETTGGAFTSGGGLAFATAGINTPISVIDGDFNGTPDLIVGTFTAGPTTKLQYFDNDNVPVGQQKTTVTSTVSPATGQYGTPETFTAKVAPFGSAPTGTVTFFVDGVSIGTAPVAPATGVATIAAPGPFALGTHTMVASYNGDSNYFAVDAKGRNFTVTAIPAAITFSFVDQLPAVNNLYGEIVQLKAQLTKVGGFTPTGSFTFTATTGTGTVTLGNVFVDTTGFAQLFTSIIPVGTNTLNATYSGDDIYATGTQAAAAKLIVVPMPTQTQVVTLANPSVFGQQITYTINLFKNTNSKVLTDVQFAGPVVLFDNDNIIANLPVDSTGQAVFTVPLNYELGNHTISATFAGSANFGGSSSTPFVQVVNKANTFTDLTANVSPITFGESVDLIAAVDVLAPGLGDVEGSDVEFYQDDVLIATVPVSQAEALFSVPDLPAGTYKFTAKFLGNDSTTGSTSVDLFIDVQPTTSTTTLAIDPSAATLGQTIVATASVVNANGIAVNTGSVTFTVNYNGSPFGTFGSPVFNGKATLAFLPGELPFGSGDISAEYSGDVSIGGSTSGAPVTFSISKAVPFALLATDGTISAPFGTDVPFSLALSPPGGITIPVTGTVQFFDNGVLFDTVAVGANNTASTSRRLTLGVHVITATYSGDDSYTSAAGFPLNYGIFRRPDRFSVGAGPGGPDRVGVYAATSAFDVNGVESLTVSKVFSPLFAFSPDHTAGVRVATADFNGDGTQDIAMATGPGTGSRVKILNGIDGALIADFSPFGEAFKGGVYISAGDIDGDLQPDIVVTPDQSGGARVRVYNGATFGKPGEPDTIADFFGIIDGAGKADTAFRGGARAAIGDVDGDGFGDIVMSAGFKGGPRIATFSGKGLNRAATPPKLFGDFFAFDPKLRNGSFVAVGDVNGDGKADIVAGAGPGGGPLVNIFSGATLLNGQTSFVSTFFAGDTDTRGGVPVSLRYLDSDNLADLVVSTGPGDDKVTAYLGKDIFAVSSTPPVAFQIDAFTGTTPDPDDQFRGAFVG